MLAGHAAETGRQIRSSNEQHGAIDPSNFISTRFSSMAFNFDKALGIHADALRLRAERTRVLASNLANESTPGYQARDIDFAASLARATAASEEGGLAFDSGAPELLYRVPHHPSADGNTVELGVEQAAFSQNAADFSTSLTFIAMKLRGLKQAIEG
jgi:flagellar basal-body rod protein FlgB